jgi:DNA polymerase-3 subunit chi
MTRIDFHTNIVDKLSYACRLTRKAYGAGGKLVLLTEDAAQAASLNEALWTLSETDFLPHVMAGDALAGQTPIIVTWIDNKGDGDDDDGQAALPHGGMLVNLTRRTPANVDRFERVFEIISTDEDDAAAGRKRYLDYKQKSYPLTHFVAGKS